MKSLFTILTFVLFLLISACRKETTQPPASATEAVRSTGTGETSTATAPVSPKSPDENFRVGSTAPDYHAEFLNGKPFRLADYRGRVVLLNVWATWCGPCRYELPVLKNLHEGHRSQGLEVVGVSIDDPDMKADVQRFANEEKINYPIALDPHGTIADLLETTVIPTSVLVDRQGKIVWYHQGLVEANDAELAGALKKAL